MSDQPHDSLFLGLDIGTGKVAAMVADRAGVAQASASRSHDAVVTTAPGRSEQDAALLREAAWGAIVQLPADMRSRVRSVGVTGQMHGVLLLDAQAKPVSNLITWQDARCLEEPGFLTRLNARTGHVLRSGYGCATLAWLAERGSVPASAVSAGSIHDWLVAILCGKTRAVTDPTDAASWGLFDLTRLDWDRRAVEAAGLSPAWLPAVRPCGAQAGQLAPDAATRLGLPAGIPVAVAIGDNQASLLATLRDPDHDLALTLGTGGQLSAILPAGAKRPQASDRYECRPYPDGRMAVVAAALSGGAAWAWLAESAAAWLSELKAPTLPVDQLYRRLNELGLSAGTELDVMPAFAGERFNPSLRGSIGNLGPGGMELGPLARGLARGILDNLRGMLPPEVLAGRTRLVGSGNALRRNELLRCMAEKVFGLPLELPESREEAAAGAARLAARLTINQGETV
jgi:sedoheptulokinase